MTERCVNQVDLMERLIDAERRAAAAEALLAQYQELAADRREKAAQRKRDQRERHALSHDVPGTERDMSGTGCDVTASPQVSSSSPTPLITTSFPQHTHDPLSLGHELLALVPDPEGQIAISAFLAHTRPEKHAAWVARLTAWLNGLDFPPMPKCTPDLLGTALREYVDEPGDYSPAHVKSFVLRTARQHHPRPSDVTALVTEPLRVEAERMWRLCKQYGFMQCTRDTIDGELERARSTGDLDDIVTFKARLQKLDRSFLRQVTTDKAAISSIAERLAAA